MKPDQFLMESTSGVIIDVRTPAEFESGHIPNAINLPLFSDEERIIVGTLYKKVSHDAAIEKGLEFVGPKMASFVKQAKKISNQKDLYLHCWRGGMRSGSMAWLLRTAGLNVNLLEGGYKAYRSAFIDEILQKPWKYYVIAGPTGSGKTEILHQLALKGEQVLDLEGIANHKGSAFGALGQNEQPTGEQFINNLHHKMRELDYERPVWCEGESLSIGKVQIPIEMFRALKEAPMIHFSIPMECRINRLVKEYGRFSVEQLFDSYKKIERRLGGLRVSQAYELLLKGDMAAAAEIALQYYDKSYAISMSQHKNLLFTHAADQDNPEQTAEILIQRTLAI